MWLVELGPARLGLHLALLPAGDIGLALTSGRTNVSYPPTDLKRSAAHRPSQAAP